MKGKSLEQASEELNGQGLTDEELDILAPQKVINGNRPSNTLYFDLSTPKTVGALIALYEHKVFVQGKIWGVNSFDQWGVELGKQLGDKVHQALLSDDALADRTTTEFDDSTQGLIEAFQSMKNKL
jgi:glucose-6-phosphate isomerase